MSNDEARSRDGKLCCGKCHCYRIFGRMRKLSVLSLWGGATVVIALVVFLRLLAEARGATDVVNFLKVLPLQLEFYVFGMLLISLPLISALCQHAILGEEIRDKQEQPENSDLDSSIWWCFEFFRKQAINCYARAGFLLLCVFILLFAGLYFFIFILPQIPQIDQRLAKEQAFKSRFGGDLGALAEGRYWVKVDENKVRVSSDGGQRAKVKKDGEDKNFCERGSGKPVSIPSELTSKEDIVLCDFKDKVVLASSESGSVFMTEDKWMTSSETRLNESGNAHPVLLSQERLVVAGLCTDNEGRSTIRSAVVVGDGGSVFVTTDGGKKWMLTQGLHDLELGYGDWEIWGSGRTCFVKSEGEYYLLRSYPRLEGWPGWPSSRIWDTIAGYEILKDSSIHSRITAFFDDADKRVNDVSGDTTSQQSTGGFINNLTVTRIATLAVLFLLAHTLVRLSLYSLRIAAFWDSRAYAILLAKRQTNKKAERFDDLLPPLTPEILDFKSSSATPFGSLRQMRDRASNGDSK